MIGDKGAQLIVNASIVGLLLGSLMISPPFIIGTGSIDDTSFHYNIGCFNGDGKILYVGGNGPNNYTRIQDAINNASDGDAIFVYRGIYTDYFSDNFACVYIDKSITVIGEDREETILDGVYSRYYVVRVSVNNVNISGFTIRHSEGEYLGRSGVDIEHPTGLDILKNVSIHDNIILGHSTGIEILGVSDGKFYNNIISHNEDGIDFGSNEKCSIYNNFISNNSVGIYMFYSKELNFIEHNHIEDNKQGVVAHNAKATIRYNNFIGNTIHAYFAKMDFLRFVSSFTGYNQKWGNNYWDNWKMGTPKPVVGIWIVAIQIVFKPPVVIPIGPGLIIHFDWHPATEPYDW